MSQTTKVRVTIKDRKGSIMVYDRVALQLLAWWGNKDNAIANTKVEFYNGKAGTRGATFAILSNGQRGGFKSSELTLKYD